MTTPRLLGTTAVTLTLTLLTLTLLTPPALAKAPSVPPEAFVRITAQWQSGGDLEEACARHGVDRQDFGLYMADLQEHDRAGYEALMALAEEAKPAVAAGQPLSEDLLARIRARGVQAEQSVGEGRFKARWLFLLFALLIPAVGVTVWLGLARMRQRTHQIYLEGLVERFDGELGTDVDLLLEGRGGIWATYTRLAAFAQLRGSYQRARFALTLEPESYGATNAGDMALVRGGPRRMLMAVSLGGDTPTLHAIATAGRELGRSGEAGSRLPAGPVAALEELGFSAVEIPDGVLLVKSGFEDEDLEEGSVVMLLDRAIGLIHDR